MSEAGQIVPSGLIFKLSTVIGTTEPALRLLLTVLTGYPLAFVYRRFLYNKNATIQHIFFMLAGLFLGWYNYGYEISHAIIAIFLSYCVLFVASGTAFSVAVIFLFNLTYLLTGYYYAGTDNYDINWTMPQCVLVLRLIGIAYDLYDGQQPPDQLSADNRKVALAQCPNIIEFFGHMLFPASFMVGPQFPMKRYQDFVAGHYNEKGAPADSVKAAGRRFAFGVAYLIVFQLLGLIVWDDYLVSSEFADLNFIKKLLLMGLWGRFTLYKYISCWLLTEGACILFGISYNGIDASGLKQWNGLANVELKVFENTTQFNNYIQSFNINTNHWLGQYIYKRLKFLGNRHISQLVSLGFLAIWHGFHSGYYVCFFFEFIVIYLERDVASLVKSHARLTQFFDNPAVHVLVQICLRFYTFVFMGWCLMPFVLLKFDRYWTAFGAVNYCGILVYGMYPIVYGPLLNMFVRRKGRDAATTKEIITNNQTSVRQHIE